MTAFKRLGLVLPVLGAVLACGGRGHPILANGVPTSREDYDQMVVAVTASASFTFNCPADQIQIAVLTGQEVYGYHLLQTVGVTACGQRATYVGFPRYNQYSPPTTSWVINASSTNAAP